LPTARLAATFRTLLEQGAIVPKGKYYIQYKLKEAGITQRELAEELGVGESLVSKVIAGRAPVRDESATRAIRERIAKLLGTTPGRLFDS